MQARDAALSAQNGQGGERDMQRQNFSDSNFFRDVHGLSHKHTTRIYTDMSTSQVRVQLSTRSPDIELPEDTGPILVSTGKQYLKSRSVCASAIDFSIDETHS